LQESFFDSDIVTANKQAHTRIVINCIHTAHRRTCAVKSIYIQQWLLLSDSIVFQSTRRYVILTSLVLYS